MSNAASADAAFLNIAFIDSASAKTDTSRAVSAGASFSTIASPAFKEDFSSNASANAAVILGRFVF